MEIMKFYKKALLATAIATSFGASAASISTSNVLKLSKEGIAAGVDAGNQQLSFDVIVDKNHPAASRITLTFDDAVRLGDLSACTGDVVTDPASGNGVCGAAAPATSVDDAVVTFDYGTGSFTFDNVSVTKYDEKKGTVDSISFDVNLGNPLIADSAFRVIIGSNDDKTTPPLTGSSLAVVLGETYVNYSSVQADLETPIETGMGKIAEETTQFGFEVSTKFDGIIDHDDLTTFVDGSTDKSVWTFTNDETLGAALLVTDADIVYSGNFKTVVNSELTASTLKVNTGTPASAPATVVMSTGTTPVAVGVKHDLFGALVAGKTAYTGTIDFTRVAASTDAIPVTTPTEVSVTIDASNYKVKAADFQDVIFSEVAGGEWKIDATIINVPYYVVNHADTQSNIHMANEADEVADVIISAIDDMGNEYGPVDLGIDLAGNTVTKVKPKQIKEALGIDDTTVLKLSVTFNIDAYAQDVAAYAFSQNSQGRSEVSNSQYKVDGKIVKTKSAL